MNHKIHGIDTCPICQSCPCVCRELAAAADCPICNSTDCRCQDRSIFELEEPRLEKEPSVPFAVSVLRCFENSLARMTLAQMSQNDRRDYLLVAIVRKLYNL